MHPKFIELLIQDFQERFWSKVNKESSNLSWRGTRCWEWTGIRIPKGYGHFKAFGGRLLKAHRVAYEIEIGPIPDGMLCMHRCDNPPCCNPAHLHLGTNTENMADMVKKHRSRHGAFHPHATLTEEIVSSIRRDQRAGLTDIQIHEKYGTSRNNSLLIRKRLAWEHIP